MRQYGATRRERWVIRRSDHVSTSQHPLQGDGQVPGDQRFHEQGIDFQGVGLFSKEDIPLAVRHGRVRRQGVAGGFLDARQVDGEGGSLVDAALDGTRPGMIGHDPVDDGQAHAGVKYRTRETDKRVNGLPLKYGHVDMPTVDKWYLEHIRKSAISHEGQFVKEGRLSTANDSGYNQGYEAFEMVVEILERGCRASSPEAANAQARTVNGQPAVGADARDSAGGKDGHR